MSNLVETFSEFYRQLIQLIDQGQQQEALALFETLDSEREQLTTLHQIATDLAHSLKLSHDRAPVITVTLERKHSLDLAHVIERDLVFTHERDMASELSRARNQAKFILAVPIMQNETA